MKRLIAFGLILNAVLLGGILLKKEVVVHAAGGGRTPEGNGDVNGDGAIDISDAVYLLEHLFLGGPAMVPIVCPPCNSCCPPVSPDEHLPATGLKKCHEEWGTEIDCASADYPGQDGFHQAGCPTEARFVDNGDGTVTDTCTGLMWQKETADVSGNGAFGLEDKLNWQEALKYCDRLDFAGHTDWRLPNVRELQSIVDYGRDSPMIDPMPGTSKEHWSSSFSTYRHRPWAVDLGRGHVNSCCIEWDDRFFVLAVRLGSSCPLPAGKGLPATGQTKCYDFTGVEIDCASTDYPGQDGFYRAGCPTEGRFVDNGDGTVTDNCTGLMWQKDTADVSGNGSIGNDDQPDWQGALRYCEDLDFAGHTDWRLPNLLELQSIVDYGRTWPAIDPIFGMSSVWLYFYWSSTFNTFGCDRPWFIVFDDGNVNQCFDVGYTFFVRAVRLGS